MVLTDSSHTRGCRGGRCRPCRRSSRSSWFGQMDLCPMEVGPLWHRRRRTCTCPLRLCQGASAGYLRGQVQTVCTRNISSGNIFVCACVTCHDWCVMFHVSEWCEYGHEQQQHPHTVKTCGYDVEGSAPLRGGIHMYIMILCCPVITSFVIASCNKT